MRNFTKILSTFITIIGFGATANAQCATVTVDVTTDDWGYECYWEVTPTTNACGTGTIGAYGNAGIVGCLGGGGQVAGAADPGAYPDLSTVTESLGCLTFGSCFDIHYVDDWGDGGATFQVYVDGVATDFFTGSGSGNVFTFCVNAQAAIDATIDASTMYDYTMTPLVQAANAPFILEAQISNVGASTVTQATINATVWDGATPLATASSTPIASLASGSSQLTLLTPGSYTPAANGNLEIEYTASIAEVDGDATNDVLSYFVDVNDSVMARDDNVILGLLGIGAVQENARLGQVFSVSTNDAITSATAQFGNGAGAGPTAGDSTKFFLYNMAGGIPTTVIDSTMGYVFTATDATNGVLLTMGFNPPISVTAGNDYLLAVGEYNANVTMATNGYNVISNTNFVNWDSSPLGGWAAAESFGAGFAVQYILRANFGPSCVPTTATQTISSCGAYTWSVDSQTYPATGMYTAVIPNAGGCDSTITLDLTIGSVDNSTSTAGAVISANAVGLTYQWIDCGSSNDTISGENGQSYTATANGDYAVIIIDGTCVDTSACVSITTIGLGENPLEQGVDIYPNPSNGNFTITVGDITASELTIVITETSGKVIFTQKFENIADQVEIPVQLKGLNAGIYFVEISADAMQTTRRVVVTK